MGQFRLVSQRMQSLTVTFTRFALVVLAAVSATAAADNSLIYTNNDMLYRTVPNVFSILYDTTVELGTYIFDTVVGGAKWPFDITITLMDVLTASYPDIGAGILAVMQYFIDKVTADATGRLAFYQKLFEIYYNMTVKMINLVVTYPAPGLQ